MKNHSHKLYVAELVKKSLKAPLRVREDIIISVPALIASIEFRREQYGLNKAEMAQVLGVSRTQYVDFTSGRRGLPFEAKVRAYNIGVPADVLLRF